MNISNKYRMLNEHKIKYCNVTYTSSVLVGSVVVALLVVVLQW
jgi:hypothetical protein